jgi:hypothetical protein
MSSQRGTNKQKNLPSFGHTHDRNKKKKRKKLKTFFYNNANNRPRGVIQLNL